LKTTIIEAIPETSFYPAFYLRGMMTSVSATSISLIDTKISLMGIWACSMCDSPGVSLEDGKRLAQMKEAELLEGESTA
jgi:hypothetical protein